jgi:hypothetical protein
MQPLDDQSPSATTGQDGIIGIGINKVQFNQVSLIDTNGYGAQATSYANRASLVVASRNASPTTLTFNGANNTQV